MDVKIRYFLETFSCSHAGLCAGSALHAGALTFTVAISGVPESMVQTDVSSRHGQHKHTGAIPDYFTLGFYVGNRGIVQGAHFFAIDPSELGDSPRHSLRLEASVFSRP